MNTTMVHKWCTPGGTGDWAHAVVEALTAPAKVRRLIKHPLCFAKTQAAPAALQTQIQCSVTTRSEPSMP